MLFKPGRHQLAGTTVRLPMDRKSLRTVLRMTAIPEIEALPETATQARRVALIVAIAFFMQLLDLTIISTSLPQMGLSFGVPAVGDEHRHHRLHADHGGVRAIIRLARRPVWRTQHLPARDRPVHAGFDRLRLLAEPDRICRRARAVAWAAR